MKTGSIILMSFLTGMVFVGIGLALKALFTSGLDPFNFLVGVIVLFVIVVHFLNDIVNGE